MVLKARAVRIVVALCSVAATVALLLLPSEHLHHAYSGEVIVHRHIIDEPSHHDDALVDHGDHHNVTLLAPTYVSERQYQIATPVIGVSVILAAPARRLACRVEPVHSPPVHGPPLRFDSLRAPPAPAFSS